MENVGQHTLYFPSNCLDSTVLRSRPLFQVASAQILRFLELQKTVAQKSVLVNQYTVTLLLWDRDKSGCTWLVGKRASSETVG